TRTAPARARSIRSWSTARPACRRCWTSWRENEPRDREGALAFAAPRRLARAAPGGVGAAGRLAGVRRRRGPRRRGGGEPGLRAPAPGRARVRAGGARVVRRRRLMRVLWHLGSTLTLYASLVGMRACEHGSEEFDHPHPYIALWL